MITNQELAERIIEKLNQNGAGLGNVSVIVVKELLDVELGVDP